MEPRDRGLDGSGIEVVALPQVFLAAHDGRESARETHAGESSWAQPSVETTLRDRAAQPTFKRVLLDRQDATGFSYCGCKLVMIEGLDRVHAIHTAGNSAAFERRCRFHRGAKNSTRNQQRQVGSLLHPSEPSQLESCPERW